MKICANCGKILTMIDQDKYCSKSCCAISVNREKTFNAMPMNGQRNYLNKPNKAFMIGDCASEVL